MDRRKGRWNSTAKWAQSNVCLICGRVKMTLMEHIFTAPTLHLSPLLQDLLPSLPSSLKPKTHFFFCTRSPSVREQPWVTHCRLLRLWKSP